MIGVLLKRRSVGNDDDDVLYDKAAPLFWVSRDWCELCTDVADDDDDKVFDSASRSLSYGVFMYIRMFIT